MSYWRLSNLVRSILQKSSYVVSIVFKIKMKSSIGKILILLLNQYLSYQLSLHVAMGRPIYILNYLQRRFSAYNNSDCTNQSTTLSESRTSLNTCIGTYSSLYLLYGTSIRWWVTTSLFTIPWLSIPGCLVEIALEQLSFGFKFPCCK